MNLQVIRPTSRETRRRASGDALEEASGQIGTAGQAAARRDPISIELQEAILGISLLAARNPVSENQTSEQAVTVLPRNSY